MVVSFNKIKNTNNSVYFNGYLHIMHADLSYAKIIFHITCYNKFFNILVFNNIEI